MDSKNYAEAVGCHKEASSESFQVKYKQVCLISLPHSSSLNVLADVDFFLLMKLSKYRSRLLQFLASYLLK